MWITTNYEKFLKRPEYQTILPLSWETCMQVKKQQSELDMEQQTGSKLGKEYIKAVYCHPAYLTYMQSTPWDSSTLATSWEELTHWKRLWCWEGLGAGGEGDDRGWDGGMASQTRWTWVWVNSGTWWWTGRPGMLWFMGSQRAGHDWATELNWRI